MATKKKDQNVTAGKALVEEFGRLSDNSMRDGQQSLDKNRVPGVLTATTMPAYERFAQEVVGTAEKEGIRNFVIPSTELWGGGQFGQPAQFLGENPIENLTAIAALAPTIRVKALYRGRQGYGFEAIHDDTQQSAIEMSTVKGVDELLVFDMMNEWDNLKKAIGFALDESKKHDGKKVIGYVCYTKPTKDGRMAWEPKELAELAVKIAQSGVDVVAIKDYAGNLWSNKEAKEWMGKDWKKVSAGEVVKTIRKALDDAGFEKIPLRLHSHGQKPEALDEALQAGAQQVDVGIGLQSGRYTDPKTGKEIENTLGHTNIRDILAIRMKKRGFSEADYADHPIMKALGDLEKKIEFASEPVMDDRRKQQSVLAKVEPKELRYHAMAGGAITALWGLVEKYWREQKPEKMLHGNVKPETIKQLQAQGLLSDRVKTPTDITMEEHFLMALKLTEVLWERGGTFGTVTPGAKICCEQGSNGAINLLMGAKDVQIIPDFKNIVIGRFGKNVGLDKGIGDVALRTKLLEGKEPALFPQKSGSGMEAAAKKADEIMASLGLTYEHGHVPSRKDAALLVALTASGGKYQTAEDLFGFLGHGARSGKIEPSRTPYDRAKVAHEIVEVAKVIDALGTDVDLRQVAATYVASKQKGHTEKNLDGLIEPLVEKALRSNNFTEDKDASTSIRMVIDYLVDDVQQRQSAVLGTGKRINAPGKTTVDIGEVAGVEALAITNILKKIDSNPGDRAKSTEILIGKIREDALVAIRQIGVDVGKERIAELEDNISTGKFNPRQIAKLGRRLETLEKFGDRAINQDPSFAEGNGALEERKALLREKIRTAELDEGDIADRQKRIAETASSLGANVRNASSRVKMQSAMAFAGLMKHVLHVTGNDNLEPLFDRIVEDTRKDRQHGQPL